MCIKASTVQGGYFHDAVSYISNCHQTNHCSTAVELSTVWWCSLKAYFLKIISKERGFLITPLNKSCNKNIFKSVQDMLTEQILKWAWYVLTEGEKKFQIACFIVCSCFKRKGKVFHVSYVLTLNSQDKARQTPCAVGDKGTEVECRSDRCLALTSEAGKLGRALRTRTGLLDYIKRSADTEIIRRKADLRDMDPKKQPSKESHW